MAYVFSFVTFSCLFPLVSLIFPLPQAIVLCGGLSVLCSFIQWMYPSGGGEENVESAALGIIILWTTWWALCPSVTVKTYVHLFLWVGVLFVLITILCRFAFNCGSTETIAGEKACYCLHMYLCMYCTVGCCCLYSLFVC